MTISTISPQVAWQITSDRFLLDRFVKEGGCCTYIRMAHQNFYHSYHNGEPCFHEVETKCLMCDWKPERNYGGYGNIYVLNNGIGDAEILTYQSDLKKLKAVYVQNKGRMTRMILLCPEHIEGYFEFETLRPAKLREYKPNQLRLFA